MGDIDFDELDKAVNNLMGKVSEKTTDDQDKLKTLAIKDTLKPDEKPQYNALDKVAQGIGDETLIAAGERETLENLGDAQPPTDPPTVVALDDVKLGEKPVEETKEPEEPVAKPVKKPNNGRFMDMMHGASDMRTTTPTPDLVVPDEHKPAPPPVTAPAPIPGPSPFLTDAKVEKRPLGGEAPTGNLAADVNDEEEKIVETESINNDEKLADDTVGDDGRALDASGFDEAAAEQEQKLQAIESVEAKEESVESIIDVESADTEKLLKKSDSKKAKDKAGNTKNADGSIYDVDNMHQSVKHPAKQKSGWGVVFIILIIIVLAAAIAGAAYFILVKP